MKLFISYARVDKPYCEQIVKTLDIHDVWVDRRLHVGQAWWDEILHRLDWCDGFVYLLSPESVASDYCQKEFEVARAAGKHLFPVLIQARTPIPDALNHIHYADVSDGLNADSVKVLLDAIYLAERQTWQSKPIQALPAQKIEAPQAETGPDLATQLSHIEALMDVGNFDQAVFLLKDLRERPHLPRVILTAITPLLQEAESELEWQSYVKKADREYRPLVALVRGKRTQAAGCEALQDFLARFPDYDPENLAEVCRRATIPKPPPTIVKATPKMVGVRDILPPPFEWCEIPAGKVKLETQRTFDVETFWMAKYPITNDQYGIFVMAQDGYVNLQWWDYSEPAKQWRVETKSPEDAPFMKDNFPRTNVSWYDAIAFCRWLSLHTNLNITLPTEQQWQRAAQGDDGRQYPWGNGFDESKSNTLESGISHPTPVTQYPDGASPYGVMDMAGNVWEWSLTARATDSVNMAEGDIKLLHGGSWKVNQIAALTFISDRDFPNRRDNVTGFRVVCLAHPPSK